MKKLITIIAALAVVLMVSGAMASTHVVRIMVDEDCDSGGFASDTSLTQTDCGYYCLRWSTCDLPYTFCGMYAQLFKTGTSEYNWHDWDAITPNGWHLEPDFEYTAVWGSNRQYSMTNYWNNPVTYNFRDCMRFRYKYNSTSNTRTRMFMVHEMIE